MEGEGKSEIEADAIMINEEMKKAEDQIKIMESHATFDVLTELLNVRGFNDKLHSEIGLIRRLEGNDMHEDMHVLFIDIDNFKSINDDPKLGHDIGDLYLKTVASYMKQKLQRDTDTLARKGGDEFAAILVGNKGVGAEYIAEELREAVLQASIAAKEECRKNGIDLADDEANVSASIGLVSLKKGEAPDELVKRADEAMYEAKRSGKNKVIAAL